MRLVRAYPSLRFVCSHPCDKNNNVARMGHPEFEVDGERRFGFVRSHPRVGFLTNTDVKMGHGVHRRIGKILVCGGRFFGVIDNEPFDSGFAFVELEAHLFE